MTFRERAFALALLIAAALITTGAALVSAPLALVVAGILTGVWTWLVLGE